MELLAEIFNIILALFLLALYLAPTIIAISTDHKQITAIVLLNILLGWTIIGWVGALIWSVIEK